MTTRAEGRPTLKDVAELAGVHPGTASRALSDSRLVREETRQRVGDAARTLGYVRNQVAASLRQRRTRTIGLLAGDLAGPPLPSLLQGAEEALRAAGYMMLTASAAIPAAGPGPVGGMLARCADGIIIAGAPASLAAPAIAAGVPVVIAGYASGDMPSAGVDLAAAAGLAAEHLASLGHRRVACISSPAAPLPGHLLVAAAQRAGLTVQEPRAADTLAVTVEEGRRCCHGILASNADVTAILTGSDILAAGCLAALSAASRPCPQAVSVTGVGDLPLAGSLTPPLTTIQLHERAAGVGAAEILLGRLAGGAAAAVQTIMLLPGLVVRGSTAPPPSCSVPDGG